MKQVLKKVVVIALVMSMLLLNACGTKQSDNSNKEGGASEKTLYVAAINKGYGIKWLEAMLEEFCNEKGWDYVIYPVYEDSILKQKIEAGIEACNYDLVFSGTPGIAGEEFLLDLSQVMEYTIESGTREGKTVAEVIDPNVGAVMGSQDTGYYQLPWTGGINGLIYNNTAIEKVLGKNWQDKYSCRTTNELLDFCKVLKDKGLAPFVHSANTNYYSFLYEVWFAQYNGTEGLSKYFDGFFTDFMGKEAVGYEVARNEGVLEAAKVMEAIFSKGYSHEKSNSIDWEVTQTLFMSGEAAMFSNGDWNNLEMSKQFPDNDIRFMKLPIISGLGTKLGITDGVLAQVVDYVDGKGEKPNVSEEVIAAVADARTWAASYADQNTVSIPKYSVHGDMAVEFLKYMISDAGQHQFSVATDGLTMCYSYDLSKDSNYNEFSEFSKTRWEIAKTVNLYNSLGAGRYGRVGLAPFKARGIAPLEVLFSRTDDRMTAQEVYQYDIDTIKSSWNTIQNNAGQ